MQNDDIELIDAKDETLNILTDFSEIGLDSLLSDGLIKDIPILSSCLSLYKAGKSISNHIAINKIIKFINEYDKISKTKKQTALTKLTSSFSSKNELGYKILLIIDRMDSSDKSALIGKAIGLLDYEDVDTNFYLRLCHLIDKSFFSDILYLKKFDKNNPVILSQNKQIPEEVIENLFSGGFLTNLGFDGGLMDGSDTYDRGTRYGLNKYGEKLKELII